MPRNVRLCKRLGPAFSTLEAILQLHYYPKHRSSQTAELRRSESATGEPPTAQKGLRLIEWRPLAKGALVGFATIQLPIGLTIRECPVLISGYREWVNLPAKPQLDRDGKPRLDPVTGKALYASIIEWPDRDTRDRVSEAVISAVREAGHRIDGSEP